MRRHSDDLVTDLSTIEKLPPELLAAIFAQLDAGSSLERRFRDDASTLLDDYYAARGSRPSRLHPLKSASLVCRRFRAAVLPLLFRHVLWTFRRLEEPSAEAYLAAAAAAGGDGGDRAADTAAACFDVLGFLVANGLARDVDGLTLHVPCPEHLIDDTTELVGKYGLVPNGSTGQAQQQQQQHSTAHERGDDASSDDYDGDGDGGGGWGDESVILSETASLAVADVDSHATWENTWFWELLFAVVDPLRISFLAAPVVLATMFSRKVYTHCQHMIMTRYHLISLSRPDRSDGPSFLGSPPPAEEGHDEAMRTVLTRLCTPPCDNLPCELFSHRRWTSLLANEGSSISIYKSEDGYGEVPPSPFLSLIASSDPATRRFFRHSLRRLAYIAVMPMATHIDSAFGWSPLVPPRLEELFVQVMPRGVHIAEYSTFEGLEMADLIVERSSVYDILFGGIFTPGPPNAEWESLRVFETGDVDDDVAWAETAETVSASSSKWDVERRGRFVRNLARERDEEEDEAARMILQAL